MDVPWASKGRPELSGWAPISCPESVPWTLQGRAMDAPMTAHLTPIGRPFWGHRDTKWMVFGHISDLFRFRQHSNAAHLTPNGYPFDIYWTFIRCPLGIHSTSIGHSSDARWASIQRPRDAYGHGLTGPESYMVGVGRIFKPIIVCLWPQESLR
ncbi:PREDICTED: uncharacterized protein LOC105555950 [Vollenhovia emeryi]|uniref:uncharacterized protein LOC105555950 n=1 Tax=Vollenhovia emeryi TaxID=411798 RepID=UPI0005F3BBDF|nr:PREDICTED: uncharacterized protein LOC105555950 [Vollenhovia emeryi]